MDCRQLNKATARLRAALRGKGKFCPCCVIGTLREERRFVVRARRRAGKALIRAEVALLPGD